MSDEKESVILDVINRMNLDSQGTNQLKNALYIALNDYSLIRIEGTDITVYEENADQEAYRMFFVAKRIQGCTERTIEFYKCTIDEFLRNVNKPLNRITTNDIRYFLAVKKEVGKVSDCYIDNLRRNLSSFFGWLHEEEYIDKNPILKVHKVKQEKYVKKAFKDIELERMRQHAQSDLRLVALMEVLLSTGCRISEVSGMNRVDIDGDEIVVHGKGKKERIVYLNAKARLALQTYLENRKDDNEALFVTKDKPYKRLEISGMGSDIRELGRQAKVPDTHPHRFRRTAATMALNRGMPIDQVSQMLGHSSIETTTLYATSAQEAVKENHKKYVV